MKKGYYILSFLLLWSALLFAQNPKFTATAGRTEVGTGEQFEVDFSVEGNGTDFNPPDFNGFQVLSGPNMSQSMTSINGATTYTTGYSYLLAAVKEGTYIIGPATINVNFRKYQSNPIKLKVVKGQPVQQNTQQAQAQAQQTAPVGNSQDIAKNLFVRAEVDKTHVYQGEQLTVNYKLYTRVAILGSQLDKAPDLNGFWNQDVMKNGQNVEWKEENYKGQRFNVATIKQTILFPEHAGNLTIDPLSLTLMVRIQQQGSGDIFEQMFGGSTKDVRYKVTSPPVIVHAMPLPDAGKPAGFSGAVGSFSVESNVDKNELKANETLNYNIKITGTGNLALINAPNINPPADFEKYDPKVTDNISVNATGTSGSRQYNYLLIPRHQGDFTFAPPGFAYFNPATKRYVTLPAKTFAIKVNKGDAQANVTALNSSNNQQDIKTLGKDIRYIKTSSPDMYKDGEGFYGSTGFYLLLILGPLAFGGALFYRKWDIAQNSDQVKLKSRKANKIANKHMAVAAKQLAAGDKKTFYEAVARGLYGYLSDKLNIPIADLNKENITAQLKARRLDDVTLNQLTDTMDLCEMARFAPVTGISEQQVFDKAKLTINEIEEKI
jgi:hypothetical protein